MIGFLKTLQRIWNCDGVNSFYGIWKHILWQQNKFKTDLEITLNLSDSRIIACNPIGVAPLVNATNIYDYNNMSLIKDISRNMNGTFVDAGANIGSYTLIASEQKNWKVISIEPHPLTFEQLVENVNLNSRDNVILINAALTDNNIEVSLMVNEKDSTKNKILNNDDQIEGIVNVTGKKLDNICRELKIEPLIVKIDVEGFEREVLNGFKECLNSVQLIIIENGEKEEIKEILYNYGFEGPLYVHYKKKEDT